MTGCSAGLRTRRGRALVGLVEGAWLHVGRACHRQPRGQALEAEEGDCLRGCQRWIAGDCSVSLAWSHATVFFLFSAQSVLMREPRAAFACFAKQANEEEDTCISYHSLASRSKRILKENSYSRNTASSDAMDPPPPPPHIRHRLPQTGSTRIFTLNSALDHRQIHC